MKSPAQGDLFAARKRQKGAIDMDIIRVEKDLMRVPMLFVMNSDDRVRKHVEPTQDGLLTLRYAPMGSHEAKVLCAIMAMLQGNYRGVAPMSYSADDASAEAEAVWQDLGIQSRAAGGFVSELRTSRRQIAEIVHGRKVVGGCDLARVMDSLTKLQSVVIHYESADKRIEYSMNLLSGYARADETLSIILNPRLVRAVDQRVPGLFSLLSLQGARRIRHEATDLLYRQLSVLMDQGATLTFRESTLIDYLWIPDRGAAPADPKRLHKQRAALRAALRELCTLTPAWAVVADRAVGGGLKYTITRPSASASKLAHQKAGDNQAPAPALLRPML